MDLVISRIISKLTNIISSRVQKEYQLVVGVTKEIEKLRSNFITIEAVLEDAERRQIQDVGVKHWLYELKQACYDMEDVLADWSTEYHEWEIEEADDEAAAADKWKRMVLFFAGCCSPLNRCFDQVKQRHDIAHKIKEICERLDQIDKNKSSYDFTVYRAPAEEHERPITSKSRVTTSHVDALKMRGRDDEKKNLINKLLCTIDPKSTREVPVAAIVGVGGIGKTTLAQLAYNDEEVKVHFEKRVWICVSEPFDKVNIAREIIRALKDKSSPDPNSSQLNLLLNKISELVNEKRILLVLDDVWNEDPNEWEQLKLSLGCANPHSRILVTTRKDNVAKVMGTTYFLPIGLLSDDECWLVFRQLAFSGRSEDECKRLEDIGWKIVVEKVKGLPLAANILGGLVQFKKSKRQWEDVLSSNLWELEGGVESKLFGPLLLSYYDLPAAMRRCFTYCAMFPKDTTMLKSDMIRMWMAQGYLNKATSSKEMELVGEEYFDNLVMRSFFQNLEESAEDIEFKMHDIVHDSAQILSGNECFSCTGKEIRTEPGFNERVRHLSLLSPSREDIESVCSAKSLRSLYIKDHSETIVEALPKLLHNLKYLRALYLGSRSIKEIPSEVKELKHLRYLNLKNLELTKIMELSKLWNLETLYLECRNKTSLLGIGIEKLINLRHLCISGYFGVYMFLPKGIGRLTSLRTLDYFIVGDEIEGTAMLRELQDMNQLEGALVIRELGKVVDVDEAVKAHLKNKKHLTSLSLDFWGDELINNQSAVLEALEGPSELEFLAIASYKGGLLPNWIISLTNLTVLNLFTSETSVDLVDLARLPSLEILELFGVNIRKYNMGDEEEEKGGTSSVVARFPKLKHLTLYEIQELEESVFAAAEIPQLIRFEIGFCPKMKDLPDCILKILPQLQELDILGCPILEEHYKKESGKYWNKISHIHSERTLQEREWQVLKQDLSHSPKELTITVVPFWKNIIT